MVYITLTEPRFSRVIGQIGDTLNALIPTDANTRRSHWSCNQPVNSPDPSISDEANKAVPDTLNHINWFHRDLRHSANGGTDAAGGNAILERALPAEFVTLTASVTPTDNKSIFVAGPTASDNPSDPAITALSSQVNNLSGDRSAAGTSEFS